MNSAPGKSQQTESWRAVNKKKNVLLKDIINQFDWQMTNFSFALGGRTS